MTQLLKNLMYIFVKIQSYIRALLVISILTSSFIIPSYINLDIIDLDGELLYSTNDPKYGQQVSHTESWHNIENLHDITRGSSSVRVCVIDGGLHPNIDDIPYDNIVDTYDYVGIDEANIYNEPSDYSWTNPHPQDHGTAVLSIMSAIHNNNLGIAGVSPDVKYAIYDIVGPSGTFEDFHKAVRRCYQENTQTHLVINLSLSAYPFSNYWNALDEALDYGAIVVAAAGNKNDGSVVWPAREPGTIAVAGLQTPTERWVSSSGEGSNYGDEITIAVNAKSVKAILNNDWVGAGVTGTSFSAPLVSGIVALLWSAFPQLTADQIKNSIIFSATDIGTSGWDQYFGFGRINAYSAYNLAYNLANPNPSPCPTPSIC